MTEPEDAPSAPVESAIASSSEARARARAVDKRSPAPGAAPLGLAIFLVSLGVLFAAGVVAYWAIRLARPDWDAGLPPAPPVLWLSTSALLASSGALHAAHRAAQREAAAPLRRWLEVALLLGLLYFAGQGWAWWSLWSAGLRGSESLYGYTVYFLTGLHAAHVLGGLVPLAVTAHRARCRSAAASREGVLLCAMYWHFLDGVWLVLFAHLLWA
ncbi:MAG: cytochrome-c oxidase [Planctomycetota bacterium]|nr:MAG: cytochrome-c oxidase [Planctomycetota bacterium]